MLDVQNRTATVKNYGTGTSSIEVNPLGISSEAPKTKATVSTAMVASRSFPPVF